MDFYIISYEVGGKVSIGGTSGVDFLLRRVRTPTTIGIAMKIIPPHRAPIPVHKAVVGLLLPPILISAPGIKLITADINPQHRPNNPGQPHRIAATTVPIMAPVFLGFVSMGIFPYD
jgi:hypothetical protein